MPEFSLAKSVRDHLKLAWGGNGFVTKIPVDFSQNRKVLREKPDRRRNPKAAYILPGAPSPGPHRTFSAPCFCQPAPPSGTELCNYCLDTLNHKAQHLLEAGRLLASSNPKASCLTPAIFPASSHFKQEESDWA